MLPYTGVGAEFAKQMDRGLELYLVNADQVKPYTITLIKATPKPRTALKPKSWSRSCSSKTKSMRLQALAIRPMPSHRHRPSPLARSSR